MQTIHFEERAKINRIDRLYETKAKPPSRSLHTKHDFVNGHDAHTHTHTYLYIYMNQPLPEIPQPAPGVSAVEFPRDSLMFFFGSGRMMKGKQLYCVRNYMRVSDITTRGGLHR